MNLTTRTETHNEGQRRASSSIATFTIGRLAAQALEFVGWIVVARSGPLDEVGAIALAILGTRYAGFLADWGAQFTGAREVTLDGPDRAGTIALLRARERATLAATLITVAALWALSGPDFIPFAGLVAARGLTRDWISLGQHRTASSLAPPLVQTATTLAGLLLFAPIADAPIVYGVGGIAGLALSLYLNPVVRRRSTTTASVGGWYVISAVAGLVYTTADSAMLGFFRDNVDVAIYSSAYRLPNAWLLLVGLAIGGAVPLATERLRSGHEARTALIRQCVRASAAGSLIVLLALPVALWAFVSIFGDAYASGRTPLAILMIATVIVTIGAPFQALVIAGGSDRRNALVMGIAAVANICANVIAIPRFGMTGAATTTLVTQALPAGFYLWSSRSIGLDADGQARRNTKPA